jgi:hypothetical protein
VKLVRAPKTGEQKDVIDIKRRWYENANEIVKFLSTINSYIPANKFKKLFYDHLALTTSEALSILHKDYKSSISL